MKIQQHIYDQEKERWNKDKESSKRKRPKSKANINLIKEINHGSWQVSFQFCGRLQSCQGNQLQPSKVSHAKCVALPLDTNPLLMPALPVHEHGQPSLNIEKPLKNGYATQKKGVKQYAVAIVSAI